nr:hypothetical protein [Anaerolineae bacterium]
MRKRTSRWSFAFQNRRFLRGSGTVLLGLGLTVLLVLSLSSCAGDTTACPAVEEDRMAAGQPLTLPFPRLGMWWPDPWEQPITDIARYDWVILGDTADLGRRWSSARPTMGVTLSGWSRPGTPT